MLCLQAFKMMTTCCAIVGLVFLVLTNLAIIIAFATPYWMVTERINRGLWAYCDHQTCTWVFQESPYYLPGQDSGEFSSILFSSTFIHPTK